MVGAIYANLDPRLVKAAGMSVLAHLEDLVARGQAATNGPPSIEGGIGGRKDRPLQRVRRPEIAPSP